MTRCRSCGAEVTWALAGATGRRMPFNAEPDQQGRWRLEHNGDALVAVHDPFAETRYTSHFATCPHAADHRKRRRDHRG